MYNGYNFWGMDMIWWFIWLIIMFWIFATPYDIYKSVLLQVKYQKKNTRKA
jgi:hypothetical protein